MASEVGGFVSVIYAFGNINDSSSPPYTRQTLTGTQEIYNDSLGRMRYMSTVREKGRKNFFFFFVCVLIEAAGRLGRVNCVRCSDSRPA